MTAARDMSTVISWLDQRWYAGVQSHWDDELLRERVIASLPSEAVALDLGAGAGRVTAMNFKAAGRSVFGIDVDLAISANRQIDGGCVGDASRLPFRDAAFDLIFADNVLEHLDQPALVFAEVARVLKPGGRFLVKTPNAWHYVTLLARLTPHGFHQWINRRRGRQEADTFPTRYLANTRTALGRLAAIAGLDVASVVSVESRPEYARINPALYALGRLYERIVNRASWGALFRVVLLADFIKPTRDAGSGQRLRA
jgi:SAM-dependent methyltransferase